MSAEPAGLDRPDHRGVRGRRRVVLHDRHRPRLRQRPVPHDAHGPVRRGAPRAGARDPRLRQLRGRLRGRDGHRPAARVHARCSSTPTSSIMAWGATVPMMAARRRHRARRDHHHLGQVGDRRPDHDGQGRHRARARSRPSTSRSTASTTARPASSSSTSTGSAPTPPPTGPGAPGRRLPGRDRGHAVDHPGDRVPVHRRQRPRRRHRRLPGDRACGPSTPSPPSTTCPPGWVTALDLPLIPGVGTIR